MNKIKKVLLEHPIITDELRKFFEEVLLNSIQENTGIPHSFVEALTTQGVSIEMVENYLTATPRLICDFMDSKNVIIEIVYIEGKFSFYINEHHRGSDHDSRKKSETASIFASIEYYKSMFNENDEKK